MTTIILDNATAAKVKEARGQTIIFCDEAGTPKFICTPLREEDLPDESNRAGEMPSE